MQERVHILWLEMVEQAAGIRRRQRIDPDPASLGLGVHLTGNGQLAVGAGSDN